MGVDDAAETAGVVKCRIVMLAWSGARQNGSFTARVSSCGNDLRMGLLDAEVFSESPKTNVTA
jgi:hypothetical protein